MNNIITFFNLEEHSVLSNAGAEVPSNVNRNYLELSRIVSFEELHVYMAQPISPSP